MNLYLFVREQIIEERKKDPTLGLTDAREKVLATLTKDERKQYKKETEEAFHHFLSVIRRDNASEN